MASVPTAAAGARAVAWLLSSVCVTAALAQPPHGPWGWHHPVRPWPRYGTVVRVLPPLATVVTLGAITYWVVDGVYYRQAGGGYEVVAPPPVPVVPGAQRTFIYPRQGQSAEQQASDEYECHRWAVAQSHFDPTAAASGEPTDAAHRDDYQRAQAACLDGRGYTVK